MAASMQAKKQQQIIGGGYFSHTSNNIQLKAGGTELSASCQTIAGRYVPASLSLHTFLLNKNGVVQIALPHQRPGGYEKTCRNLKLASAVHLTGEAQCTDGRYIPFTFNLDDFVANDDGKLCVHGGFFSRTSKDITFAHDGKLKATCQKKDGAWAHSELDLDYLIENVDGTLCYASPPPPGHFMESCDNVRLIGTKLVGCAKRYDSTYTDFELQLDYNISNQDGKLVWSTNPV